jgi:hypothetical protein
MVLATFAIEHTLFEESPHVSHFFNVLLFAITCMLLLFVLQKIFKKNASFFALAITLIFAVHTIHTEAVCSIKNRDELLALFFGLLTLNSALNFIDGKKISLLFMFLFYTAALMSKVSIMSFIFLVPFLILLFYEATFIEYLSIMTVMILPNHFFITNIGSVGKHFFISIGIFLFSIIAYYIFHRKKLFAITKALIFEFKKAIKPYYREADDSLKVDTLTIQEFKNGLRLPPVRFMIPSLILLLTFFTLIRLEFVKTASLIAIMLPVLSMFFRKELAFWAIVHFLPILLYVNLTHPISINFDVNTTFFVFLFFSFYHNLSYRSYFLIFAIILAVTDLSGIFGEEGFMPIYILYGLFLFIGNKKWSFFLQIVLVIFFLCIGLVEFVKGDFFDLIAALPFPLFFLLLNYEIVRKKMLYPLFLWASMLLAYSVFDYAPYARNKNSVIIRFESARNHIEPKSNYTNLIPTGNNRILNFVEQSIQHNDTWQVKVGTSFSILLKYFQKVIVPYPLAFYYGYSEIEPVSITATKPLIGVIVYLMLFLLAVYGWFRDKILASGILIYLFSIVFFANYFAPVPGMLAERFLLIPSLGFSEIVNDVFESSLFD